MLRKIAPDQVQLGMYIHGFEGSWFRHPFWRTRFLLTAAADLEAVRVAEVKAVIVDISKGQGMGVAPYRIRYLLNNAFDVCTPDGSSEPRLVIDVFLRRNSGEMGHWRLAHEKESAAR